MITLAPLHVAMGLTAADVQRDIDHGHLNGLSKDAACLGALIGVLSYIRLEGMAEESLLRAAQQAVPVRHQVESLRVVES